MIHISIKARYMSAHIFYNCMSLVGACAVSGSISSDEIAPCVQDGNLLLRAEVTIGQ